MPDPPMVAEQRAQGIRTWGGASPETAFEALFRQHQRAVYSWILRIVRNSATAEDLTIEAFWRIHQAMARFEAKRGFEPWARRIATRIAIDWLRSHRRETTVADGFFASVPTPGPSDPAIAAEIRTRVARAFSRLPPKLYAAAALAVIEGVPYKEIAAALEISVAAVKLRVFRALRLLRNDLRKEGFAP
jgi:RNA polymerase sigma-70 factor, ECF subfamily